MLCLFFDCSAQLGQANDVDVKDFRGKFQPICSLLFYAQTTKERDLTSESGDCDDVALPIGTKEDFQPAL